MSRQRYPSAVVVGAALTVAATACTASSPGETLTAADPSRAPGTTVAPAQDATCPEQPASAGDALRATAVTVQQASDAQPKIDLVV